jgi:homoserine O-acetyltransferase/O-succinyltransferase
VIKTTSQENSEKVRCDSCPYQNQHRTDLQSKHLEWIEITKEKPFPLECGKSLSKVHIAFEIFGEINSSKNNVILIAHAFTGDAHVGIHPDEPNLEGWWKDFVGPGKPFDTSKYAIICSNVLGGCMGSTGPNCINPETNKPYGLKFPLITIKDMVNAQKWLLDQLGISQLLAVAGGSMGGMQVLEWAISYPKMVKAAIPIATTSRLSPQGIAFNEVGRRAILNDPNWDNGNYNDDKPPINGLKLARMIGHITYLSDESMRDKFGRDLRNSDDYRYAFVSEFEVESYLNYQGEKFTKRFDANSYLYLSKAQDYFDLKKAYGSLVKAFSDCEAKFLIMAFESDWLYPIYQSKEIMRSLQQAGKEVSYTEIDTNYGHDAFLLEYGQMAPIIAGFIDSVYSKNGGSV